MTVTPSLTLAAGLLAVAVLVWPRPPRAQGLPRSRSAGAPHRRRRPWWWRRPRRYPAGDVDALLTLLDAVGPALRAGLAPGDALRAVAPEGVASPVGRDDAAEGRGSHSGSLARPTPERFVSDLLHGADRGEPLAPIWRQWATRTGSSDLGLVAAAWALCERLGAPLAATVATVGSVVRRRAEVERRTAAALAGPRASMAVLTVLPLAGPLIALVMGLSPLDLYASPPGAAALGAGLALLLVGRWWGARLVRSIERPRRAGGRS
jgi:tight adherence protein B